MENNLPCPFCGHQPKIKHYDDGMFRAVCGSIHCPVESFKYHTEQEALDWWNKRKTAPDRGGGD